MPVLNQESRYYTESHAWRKPPHGKPATNAIFSHNNCFQAAFAERKKLLFIPTTPMNWLQEDDNYGGLSIAHYFMTLEKLLPENPIEFQTAFQLRDERDKNAFRQHYT